MKKRIVMLTLVILCLCALTLPVCAANASGSLTGPGIVRSGDTITLTFQINGKGIYGASGALSYNTAQLELISTSQSIGNGWEVEFNGNNFVVYDNKMSNPINSNASIFTVKFKVKSLSTGTKVNVSCKDVLATDGNADINIGTVSYSATIAAPLSTDNTLGALDVENATISPKFSANVTEYTAEVPFEVSKLQINAKAADGAAKVSINNPDLTPNATTKVQITVTAENGVQKTYTISVKRAQDPNYVPSGNNDLAAIQVEGFLLSPVFDPECLDYVIWLPYETENVTVSSTASDTLASVRIEGGTELIAGADNIIKVICTAENGNEKVYTVLAKRAAAHDAQLPDETEPSAPTETIPEETQPTQTQPSTPNETHPGDDDLEENVAGIPIGLAFLLGLLCVALGFAGGVYLTKRKY